ELGGDALDRALDAERLAASDAAKRLFFLQHEGARACRAKIELRVEADDLLGASRLAQPALDASVLREAQYRAFLIVGERTRGAGGHARKTERAALHVELDGAERRAFGQRDDVDRGRGRVMQLAQREPQHVALGADRRERGGTRGAGRRFDRAQCIAKDERIIRLDRDDPAFPKAEAGEDRLRERDRPGESRGVVSRLCAGEEPYVRYAVREGG